MRAAGEAARQFVLVVGQDVDGESAGAAAEGPPALLLALRRLQATSGGSSDTELKELQVRPTGWPSAPVVVMMATPVGKLPSALRNALASKAGAGTRSAAAASGVGVMGFSENFFKKIP